MLLLTVFAVAESLSLSLVLSLTLSFSASFVATLAESAQASACLKQTHKNDMETMAKEQCNWQAAARQWQKQNIFLISLSVVARRYSFARDGDHPLSLSLYHGFCQRPVYNRFHYFCKCSANFLITLCYCGWTYSKKVLFFGAKANTLSCRNILKSL